MSGAATPNDSDGGQGDTDPFAELAEEHPEALRRYADSDLKGAWVAKAILNATDEDGGAGK